MDANIAVNMECLYTIYTVRARLYGAGRTYWRSVIIAVGVCFHFEIIWTDNLSYNLSAVFGELILPLPYPWILPIDEHCHI